MASVPYSPVSENRAQHDHAELKVYADMAQLKVLPDTMRKTVVKVTEKREKITTFSKKSRARMFRTVAKIRNLRSAIWFCITYPDNFTFTPEQVKKHFNIFKKRWFRAYPDTGWIWRLEIERRKSGTCEGMLVPHFHVIVLHQHWIDIKKVIQDVRDDWNEIVAPEDEAHYKASTRVELLQNRKHVIQYVSKYVGKAQEDKPQRDEFQNWGRYWGVCGKVDLKPIFEGFLTYPQFAEMRRNLSSLMAARAKKDAQRIAAKKGIEPKEARLRAKKYAKRIKKGGRFKGTSVLGCGDQSNGIGREDCATIWKVVIMSICVEKDATIPLAMRSDL